MTYGRALVEIQRHNLAGAGVSHSAELARGK